MNDFESKCEILGDLWIEYKDDEAFTEFIEYNDLGLPLAYSVSASLASVSELGEKYINETWDLLIEALGLDGHVFWDSLEHMLEKSVGEEQT